MRDWLRQIVEEPRHEYPHFVAALSLIAALPPDEIVGLLTKRAGRLADESEETRKLIAETSRRGCIRSSSWRRTTGSLCWTPRWPSSRASSNESLAAGFPTPRITSRSGTAKRLGESPLGDSLP